MRQARKSRNIFGFQKKVTYHRDVASERADLARKTKAARRESKAKLRDLLEEAKDDGYQAGQSDKQAGKKPTPYRMSLIVSPRYEAAFGKRRAHAIVHSAYAQGYKQNPERCARTLKSNVSDRAKRYRANQAGCRPSGLKKCKLCGSRSDVMVDHVDGNESNGRKSNLRWLCRSCNNTLGAEMARDGVGRRTVQYNPKHKGAQNLGEYMQAVLQHTRGAHDAAGKIIHDTPKSKRREFASEIWSRRESHGTARGFSSSASGQEPDWVTNPKNPPDAYTAALYSEAERAGREQAKADKSHGRKRTRPELDYVAIDLFNDRMDHDQHESGVIAFFVKGYNEGWRFPKHIPLKHYGYEEAVPAVNPAASAAQYRLAQAVLSGTARTRTHMTRKVAQEIVDSTPAHLRSEYSRNPALESTTEYRLGYNLGQADRQTAALRKTPGELHATFVANFGGVPMAHWPAFDQAYQAGFGGNIGAAAPNPELRPGAVQVIPSARRKGMWTVTVGGIPRTTKATRRGAENYAQRIRDANPETSDIEDDGSEQYHQAKRIAELFHGRPVKEHITVTESIHTPDWYAALGPLAELRVKGFKGAPFRTARFPFGKLKGNDVIQFFASPDGKQFYLRGGDQEIDLDALNMGPDSEWYRDSMLIGEVTYFAYRDGKKFHGFKLTEYTHKVGSALDESGTRHIQKTNIKPVMIYDTLSKKISLAGGLGKVETETLVEGMSPGIVN